MELLRWTHASKLNATLGFSNLSKPANAFGGPPLKKTPGSSSRPASSCLWSHISLACLPLVPILQLSPFHVFRFQKTLEFLLTWYIIGDRCSPQPEPTYPEGVKETGTKVHWPIYKTERHQSCGSGAKVSSFHVSKLSFFQRTVIRCIKGDGVVTQSARRWEFGLDSSILIDSKGEVNLLKFHL